MKRPLACFGFSLFAVLLCLNFFEGTAASVSLAMVFLTAFVASLIFKKSRRSLTFPVIFFGLLVGCLLFFFYQSSYENTVLLTGENINVVGRVTEAPSFSREKGRHYLTIKADNIDGERVRSYMRVSFSERLDGIASDDIEIGDHISFSATVYKINSSSAVSYYKSKDTYLGAYAIEEFTVSKPSFRPVGYYMHLLRSAVKTRLMHDFDNNIASILVALLTGDKSHLSDELYEKFIRAGVIHIMAVSGLHLSIWVTFLSIFVTVKGKRGKLLSVLMIIFVIFMMNFACFTGSVKRAGAMTILHFVGKLLGRKSDSLNSLGFAAVCGLLPSPFSAVDISFLLSFLSTLGIIVMGIPLSEKLIKSVSAGREKLKKFISPFATALAFSVSVSLFVFPVSVLILGGVSFIAPVTNVLCFIAVSPLLLLTGFYPFLRLLPLISPIMAITMKHLTEYILFVVRFASSLPFAYVNTDYEKLSLWFMAAFFILILAIIFYKFNRILTRLFSLVSLGVLLLSFSFNFYASLDKCKITVYGDSSGSSTVVSLNGTGVIIGFEGNSYNEDTIFEYAKNNNIKITCAVFNESFVDAFKKSLCERLGIKKHITEESAHLSLYDKVKISREGKDITVDASEIKTEIFYKDYLQDEDKCDTIKHNDGIFEFFFKEDNEYTLKIITSGGEQVG